MKKEMVFYLSVFGIASIYNVHAATNWIGITNDMTVGSNWSAGTPAPGNPGQFNNGGTTSPNLPLSMSLTGDLAFVLPYASYTVSIDGTLHFDSVGVTNSSGSNQTFAIGSAGLIVFENSQSAAAIGQVTYNNISGPGEVQFLDSSTSGDSVINLDLGAKLLVTHNITIPTLSSNNSADVITISGGTLETGTGFTNTTIKGKITGAGGLEKSGPTTTLTLSGTTNDYSGQTQVTAGTLAAGAANTFSSSSDVLVGPGGVLDLNTHSQSIRSLSGSGKVQASSGGTPELKVNMNADLTFSGNLTETGGATLLFTKDGGNALFLTGSNNYSGKTTVNDGSLVGAATNTFSPNSDFYIVGPNGVLDLYGDQTIQSLNGNGTIISNGGTVSILTVNNSADCSFYGTIVDGTARVGLTKSGGAGTTLYLYGTPNTNTYSGLTTVSAGFLSTEQTNILSANSNHVVNGTLSLDGYSQEIGALSGANSGIVKTTLGAPTLTVNVSTSPATFSGDITDTAPGVLAVTKIGAANWTLDGSNDYHGTTTVSQGTLTAGAINTFSTNSNFVVDGTVELNGYSQQIQALSGGSSGNVNTASGTPILTVTISGTPAPFSGTLTESGGGKLAVTELGGGTWELAGSNSYSGQTLISSSTMKAGTGASGAFSPNSDFFLSSGTLDLNGTSQTIAGLQGSGSVTTTVSGSATLEVDTSTSDPAFNGVIGNGSGTMNLTKSGTGTLSLGGVNTYTGDTQVLAGTLRATAGPTFPSGSNFFVGSSGTVELNGFPQEIGELTGSGIVSSSSGSPILTVNVSGTPTFSGSLTGTLGIEKKGGGTWTLDVGPNNYTGITTISNGTLATASAGILSSSSHFNISSGTLDLKGGNQTIAGLTGAGTGVITTSGTSLATLTVNTTTLDFPFLGVIGDGSGKVGLTKNGTGTLKLGGANTYTGATSVLDGTLQAQSANTLSSGSNVFVDSPGTVNLNGFSQEIGELTGSGTVSSASSSPTLTVNVSGTPTFSGELSGTLGVVKQGTGTWTLSGTSNVYTGNTTVADGTLLVNGSIDSPITTVDAGATLGGNGTITSIVTVNGTMSPGASIGTLNVVGNYTQGPNSFFINEINPLQSDLLAVTGTVTIDPTALFVLVPSAGSYAAGAQFPVITSGDGVTGMFANNEGTIGPVLWKLTYPGNEVLLSLDPIAFFTQVKCGNGAKVGAVVEEILNSGDFGSQDMEQIIDGLISLSNSELNSAFSQMQPALYTGMTIVQQNNIVKVHDALKYRLQTTLDSKACPKQKKKQCAQTALANTEIATPQAENSSEPQTPVEPQPSVSHSDHDRCVTQEKRVHVWVNGLGDFLHQDPEQVRHCPSVGYNNTTAGLVSGVDVLLGKYLYVGALGAYTHSDIDWTHQHADADINSGYAGLYLSAIGKLFYINASVIGAWSGTDAQRQIKYTGVNRTAKAHLHSTQLLSHADTGLNFQAGKYTIRPFDAFDYMTQEESKFTESGAKSLDLVVKRRVANMIRNELGVNLARCFPYHSTRWLVDAKFSWVREVRFKGASYTAHFVGIDNAFRVSGFYPDRNLFSPGLSVTGVLWQERLTVQAYYEGEFGSHYNDQSVGGQVGIRF